MTWTHLVPAGLVHSDGFPARAGMDPGRPDAAEGLSRIPRARGDGPGVLDLLEHGLLDSPRARGWTLEAELARLGFNGPAVDQLRILVRAAGWRHSVATGDPSAPGEPTIARILAADSRDRFAEAVYTAIKVHL